MRFLIINTVCDKIVRRYDASDRAAVFFLGRNLRRYAVMKIDATGSRLIDITKCNGNVVDLQQLLAKG